MPSPRTKRYDDRKVIEQIQALDAKGHTVGMIASSLNDQGIPAPRGGLWKPANVRHVLEQNRPEPPARPKNPMCIHVEQHFIRRGDVAAKVWKPPFGHGWDAEVKYDEVTGEVTKWTDYPMTEEEIHETDERRCLEYRAIQHLTWTERAARITFQEPSVGGFGVAPYDAVSSIVDALTRATGKDVNALLDQIEGQPAVKGSLRMAVKRLLTELAIQRQTNLALRQQLVALKDPRHTEVPAE